MLGPCSSSRVIVYGYRTGHCKTIRNNNIGKGLFVCFKHVLDIKFDAVRKGIVKIIPAYKINLERKEGDKSIK